MIPILYGSQTGTSIDLCNILQGNLPFKSFILPIDSFNILKINDFPLIIIVCSTHGNGQCPFNMANFWKVIMTDIPAIFKFKFAILGLGDSSYEKYNYCAKIVHNRLIQLGAEPVIKELADSQDKNGPYDGFAIFKDRLISYLNNIEDCHRFFQVGSKNSNTSLYGTIENSNTVITNTNITSQNQSSQNNLKISKGINNNESKIDNNIKLITEPDTSKDSVINDKNTIKNRNANDYRSDTLEDHLNLIRYNENYLIKNDLINFKKSYKAKVISNRLVTPESYDRKVYELVLDIPDYQSFYPGDCIRIDPKNVHVNLKYKESENEYIKENIDLMSTPQQSLFKDLSEIAKTEPFKDKLLEISADYELYHSYIAVPRRTISEVADDFKLSIPFRIMLNHNRIYPRYYSFSKVGEYYSILYNETLYKTVMSEQRKGLCSEYLKSLSGEIEVGVEPSKLYAEEENLLFFATGTGVTLPRSALHFFKEKKIRIYYGFRYYGVDQLCKEEFKNAEIFYASSQDDGKYIMDVYRSNPVDNIDDWLVFTSGNCRINKEIRKVLKEIHGKEVVFQAETW